MTFDLEGQAKLRESELYSTRRDHTNKGEGMISCRCNTLFLVAIWANIIEIKVNSLAANLRGSRPKFLITKQMSREAVLVSPTAHTLFLY